MRKFLITVLVIFTSIWFIKTNKSLVLKPSIVVNTTENSTSTPKISKTTSTMATSTPKQVSPSKKITVKKQMTAVAVPLVPVIVPTPIIETPPPDFAKINETARKSVVNILCTTKGAGLSPISGTGVLVNSDG